MKILLMRLMGLGDVASILVPAARIYRQNYPASQIDVLTYDAGVEVMSLVNEVDGILAVEKSQWPASLPEALTCFWGLGEQIAGRGYDLVVNLDTWFMPCVLARILKDVGICLEGNYLNDSLPEFLQKLNNQEFTQDYFQNQSCYLASTYPHMSDWWSRAWWLEDRRWPNGYPAYYLAHCCGLAGALDFELDVPVDWELRNEAAERPVVAISVSGRGAHKQYLHAESLRQVLEEQGYFVWSQFDGSLPIDTLLSKLRSTDLLITVPTSSRWLAKAVNCPVLLLPGGESPEFTAPEAVVAASRSCQFCNQSRCDVQPAYACLDIPAERVIESVKKFLG